jgi:hypothetical protein
MENKGLEIRTLMLTSKKLKPFDLNRSFAVREQLRIGQQIADQLTPINSTAAVARAIGISDTMVKRIELQALYKIQARLKELMKHEQL